MTSKDYLIDRIIYTMMRNGIQLKEIEERMKDEQIQA